MQVDIEPPALSNEELLHYLLVEEVVAKEDYQGREISTLEVVMEVSGLLTYGQMVGLEGPAM